MIRISRTSRRHPNTSQVTLQKQRITSMQKNATYLVQRTAAFPCIGRMQMCALSLGQRVFIQRCIIRGPVLHFLPSSSHLRRDRVEQQSHFLLYTCSFTYRAPYWLIQQLRLGAPPPCHNNASTAHAAAHGKSVAYRPQTSV